MRHRNTSPVKLQKYIIFGVAQNFERFFFERAKSKEAQIEKKTEETKETMRTICIGDTRPLSGLPGIPGPSGLPGLSGLSGLSGLFGLSGLSGQKYTCLPASTPPNFLSKGVRLGLSQKSRRWAVLGVLLIDGTFWDRPQIAAFHGKEPNLLSKGV